MINSDEATIFCVVSEEMHNHINISSLEIWIDFAGPRETFKPKTNKLKNKISQSEIVCSLMLEG